MTERALWERVQKASPHFSSSDIWNTTQTLIWISLSSGNNSTPCLNQIRFVWSSSHIAIFDKSVCRERKIKKYETLNGTKNVSLSGTADALCLTILFPSVFPVNVSDLTEECICLRLKASTPLTSKHNSETFFTFS